MQMERPMIVPSDIQSTNALIESQYRHIQRNMIYAEKILVSRLFFIF